MDASSTVGDMTIAKVSPWIVGFAAVLLIPTFLRAFDNPTPLSIAWVLIGICLVSRVAMMQLRVDREHVVIRNYFRTTRVPIWEAEVEVVQEEGANPFLSDAGGKVDQGGRSLCVVRMWNDHEKVGVTVAPRYGRELDRIHDELIEQIRHQRAA